MKLFKKRLSLADLLPPIVYRRLQRSNAENGAPFLHPNLRSFSQYQEDLIVDVLCSCKPRGFYIDVGANDPDMLSNTRRYYLRGWSGINIEPNPELYARLLAARPNDVNLNCGIAAKVGQLRFYMMSADTLSSFDKRAALGGGRIYGAHLVNEIIVPTLRLSDVFAQYVTGEVDFLSIDTEGYDRIVLASNDWERYRPRVVLVEINQAPDEITTYLNSKDYELLYSNHTNGVFWDSQRTLL